MTTRVKVTKRDAERVLAAVKKAYGAWIMEGDRGPVLMKDYAAWNSPAPYAVVWEEGPFEWTFNFPFGGIEEEFGSNVADVSAAIPKAVFCEAMTSWCLGIYEA